MEYNILGTTIKLKDDSEIARKSIELVSNEVELLKEANKNLSSTDLAVLVALKFASTLEEVKTKYSNDLSGIRSEIHEALSFIEEVSPGSMQIN